MAAGIIKMRIYARLHTHGTRSSINSSIHPILGSSNFLFTGPSRRAAVQTRCHKSRNAEDNSNHCHSHSHSHHHADPDSETITKHVFWTSKETWKRAAVNTTRCLIGCTSGDFSSMWFLQTYWPDLGMGAIMPISMTAGLATSLLLETLFLRFGSERLPLMLAGRTALGMSFFSMLAMEAVESIVDYNLTGGVVTLGDPKFWLAGAVSMTAGWLAPLPYNYIRLRKYGIGCH